MSRSPLLLICFAFGMWIATYHQAEAQVSLEKKAKSSSQGNGYSTRYMDDLTEKVTHSLSSVVMGASDIEDTTIHTFSFIPNAPFKKESDKTSTQVVQFSITGPSNEKKFSTQVPAFDVTNVVYEEKLSTEVSMSDATGISYNKTSSENTSRVTTLDTRNYEDVMLQIHILVQYIQNTFVLPIFCPISIVCNIIVVYTMVKKIQTNTANRYLLTLLITDIISLVSDLCLPIATTLGQYTSSQFEREAAAIVFNVNISTIGMFFRRINLNMFCVLSYERFIAIAKPFKVKTSATSTKFHWFLVGSILLACLTTIPTLVFVPLQPDLADEFNYFYMNHTIKYEPGSIQRITAIVIRILDGPIHIIFFTVMNILSVKSLRGGSTLTNLKQSAIRTRKYSVKLFKVYLFLSVTNIISWLPQSILIFLMLTRPDASQTLPLLNLIVVDTHILRALNSMTDYVFLLLMSKENRKNVKEFLSRAFVCNLHQNADIEERVPNE